MKSKSPWLTLLSEDEVSSLAEISSFIHSNPETGFKEFMASERLADFLNGHSFTVKKPLIDELPTSFKAVYRTGSGEAKPLKIGIMAEYDALRNAGHACGHNLISVCSCSSAVMLKRILCKASLDAEIIVYGTPGEEQLGGKVKLSEAGVFDDLDCAMMCHPADMTSTDRGSYAVCDYHVSFHGRASHAGSAPEHGVNALDAMIMLFNGIGLWRQQLPSTARVHGIITNGGQAPNIIPELTEAFIYLRSSSLSDLEAMEGRFKNMVQGSALACACTFETEIYGEYMPLRRNMALNDEFANVLESFSEPVIRAHGNEWKASTDFGNVSQRVPSAHCFFGISEGASPLELHTDEFRVAAARPGAFTQALKGGFAMAETLSRFVRDSEFREAVKRDFGE